MLFHVISDIVKLLISIALLVGPVYLCRHNLFSFQGRIGRKDYLLKGLLPINIATLVLLIYSMIITDLVLGGRDFEISPVMARIVLAIIAVPLFAIHKKRCHDIGRSAWYMLLLLVPIVGQLYFLYEMTFVKGSAGDNRFGPDPLAPTEFT